MKSLHKSLHVTIFQNEAYGSLLWYWAERSSAWMQKCPAMGRPISFRDNTAPHVSALYSWQLNGPQLAWRGGVYALLHQDNSCGIDCYWLIPSIQWELSKSCTKSVRQKLHAPSMPKLRKNCVAQDRNFLGGLTSNPGSPATWLLKQHVCCVYSEK